MFIAFAGHALQHTALHRALSLAAIRPVSPQAILALLGLGLLVGCLQEGLQLFSAGVWPGWPPKILDLSVDLIGASLGIGLSRLTMRIQKPAYN